MPEPGESQPASVPASQPVSVPASVPESERVSDRVSEPASAAPPAPGGRRRRRLRVAAAVAVVAALYLALLVSYAAAESAKVAQAPVERPPGGVTVRLDARAITAQNAQLQVDVTIEADDALLGPDGTPAQHGTWPASYRIFAEVDDDLHDTPLGVIGQRGRLPLHPQDGRLFTQPVVSLRAGIETFVGEVPAGPDRAFLRLFVNLPPADCGAVAVLDPPLHTLEASV